MVVGTAQKVTVVLAVECHIDVPTFYHTYWDRIFYIVGRKLVETAAMKAAAAKEAAMKEAAAKQAAAQELAKEVEREKAKMVKPQPRSRPVSAMSGPGVTGRRPSDPPERPVKPKRLSAFGRQSKVPLD